MSLLLVRMGDPKVAHSYFIPFFRPTGRIGSDQALTRSRLSGMVQRSCLTLKIMNAIAPAADGPSSLDAKNIEALALAPQRSLIAFFVDPEAQVVQETQLPLAADGSGPDLNGIKERLGSPSAGLGWVTLTHESLPGAPSLHLDFSSADAAAQENGPIAQYSIAFCLDQARGALCEPNLPHGTHGAFTGQAFVVFFEDMSDGDSRPLAPPMSAQQFSRFCGFPTERQTPPSLIPLTNPLAPKIYLPENLAELANQQELDSFEEPASLRATGPLDFLADFDEWGDAIELSAQGDKE